MVRYLVEQFLGLAVIQIHRGTAEFEQALSLAMPLLHGRALDEESWSAAKRSAVDLSQSTWVRVQPGQELNRQDRVRVRPDAYDDQRAMLHNGRIGSILMVRYGRAVVHYEGDPPGRGHDHDIRLLDKLVVGQ